MLFTIVFKKQVGPGGVAISTPVEGGSAGNGGIAIAGAQGVAVVFALIDEGNKLFIIF